MEKSNEELAREIKELREEVRQMREVIGVLLSMVIEEDEDEGIPFFSSGDVPRLNN